MQDSDKKGGLNIAWRLRGLGFFRDLDDETIERFEEIANVMNFLDNETIVLAGDPRNAIFFISKGSATVLSSDKLVKEGGLGFLVPGDFFGEAQIFSETGRNSISVRADGPCEVIIFRGKEFLSEVASNPKLAMAFLREASRKVCKAYMQIAALSMNTLKKRISKLIMMLIEEMGTAIPPGINSGLYKLRNCPSQAMIADMCGTTRETANRELSDLIKKGYIKMQGKDLILMKDLKF